MKNVLITGASRGIGKALVEKFTESGYRVFLNYNKSKDEALKISEKTGAIPVFADVSNSSDVKNMIQFITKTYGGISVLVNNAGISLPQKVIIDVSEEEWDNLFNVNVKGMFNVTKEILPIMINKKYGSIINISSMWGVTGGSCEVAYSASKAAVIGFTKALAKEVGPSGIRVNCVAPGVIKTDMNSNLSDEDFNSLKEETPLSIIGEAEDVSDLVLFLAEDSSKFITGEVININGGLVI